VSQRARAYEAVRYEDQSVNITARYSVLDNEASMTLNSISSVKKSGAKTCLLNSMILSFGLLVSL
jgi:hypothetical protein